MRSLPVELATDLMVMATARDAIDAAKWSVPLRCRFLVCTPTTWTDHPVSLGS